MGHDGMESLQASLSGRYTIVRELGRGGMATVYLAEDAKHGRSVALKVLHPELRGDTARARAYADTARAAFEIQLTATPTDPQLHMFHALALAYLGRPEEAARDAQRGVELLPLTKDGSDGPYMQHQLARVYIVSGNSSKALDALEPLLRVPYILSPGWLRIDPNFKPLKGSPRFEKLLGEGPPTASAAGRQRSID